MIEREGGGLRAGEGLAGSGAAAVEPAVVGLDGQLGELSDRGRQREVGPVALAEQERDGGRRGGTETDGPGFDRVRAADREILEGVAPVCAGSRLATGRRRRCW